MTASPLADLVREYVRDLRRNSSGGDDYPWEWAKGTADYLEVLIERAGKPTSASHVMCIGWPTIKRLAAGESIWFDDLQCGAVAADDLCGADIDGLVGQPTQPDPQS